MSEAGLEDGAKRAFDGEWRVHYGGYWVKAYDAPADSLLATMGDAGSTFVRANHSPEGNAQAREAVYAELSR